MTSRVSEDQPPGGRRLALVVAVAEYDDPALRELRAPSDDAIAMRDLLEDPSIGGFTVTSVIDGRAQQIRLAVEEFLSDRSTEDVLLVYLSCHGLVDLRRRLYFAAQDTVKNRLAASGVESHWLLDQLEDCRARRQVVILDCCFSGAFAQGTKGNTDLGLGERLVGSGRGRVVLTASRATEYSFEGEPVPGEVAEGSVFTGALVDGIRSGAADTDDDGYITVDDAYAYAFDRVREAGAQQTPQRWLYGAEGSILLARNPVVRSTGPPPEKPPEPARVAPEQPPAPAQPRRRLLYAAAATAAAVVVAAVVTVVLLNRSPGGNGSGSRGTPQTGKITATAPWRMIVRDDIDGPDDLGGCTVTLTNPKSNHTETVETYGTQALQVHEGGQFEWRASDTACRVFSRAGAGTEAFPVEAVAYEGDTNAFQAPGKVTVTPTYDTGVTSCELTLLAISDGGTLDSLTAVRGKGPVELDTQGALAYLEDPPCDVRVTAAP